MTSRSYGKLWFLWTWVTSRLPRRKGPVIATYILPDGTRRPFPNARRRALYSVHVFPARK